MLIRGSVLGLEPNDGYRSQRAPWLDEGPKLHQWHESGRFSCSLGGDPCGRMFTYSAGQQGLFFQVLLPLLTYQLSALSFPKSETTAGLG